MDPSEEIDEWAQLKNVTWDWIEKRPGVDEKLTSWLDATEVILRSYQVLIFGLQTIKLLTTKSLILFY